MNIKTDRQKKMEKKIERFTDRLTGKRHADNQRD
jgi:hypothetical protein